MIKNFFYGILPFVEAYAANKNISKSIAELGEKAFEDKKIFEELKSEYNLTFQRKDKFEDKAKNNIISVTIAVTLIMGALPLIKEFISSDAYIVSLLGVISFVISVAYMIIAGVNAFTAIIEKNTVYISKLNNDDLDEIRQAIEGNNYYNLIRNNLVNASYRCIRNSLVCMFFVMILLITTQFELNSDKSNIDADIHTTYFYNAEVIKSNRFEDIQLEVEESILNSVTVSELGIGEIIGIIDTKYNLFIKVRKVDETTINILMIEHFEIE